MSLSELISKGFIRISLTRTGVGHFETQGRVGGHALTVLVDTGAASTVVDIETARRLGLELAPLKAKGGGAGGATLDVWRIEGAALAIEGRVLTAEDALYAMDLSHVAAALAAQGVAAPSVVLGADVLIPRDAIIDYGAQALYLRTDVGRRAA